MEIVQQDCITVKLTMDEVKALTKLIGEHSGHADMEHGLTEKQSELLSNIYCKFGDIVGD